LRPVLSATRRARLAFRRSPNLMFASRRGFKKAIGTGLLLCLPLLPCSGHAETMKFRLVPAVDSSICSGPCGTSIAADGEITDATPEDFRSFLRVNAPAHQGRTVVFIDSPGGKIVAGIELGKIFRKIGATACVARIVEAEERSASEPAGGICFSACVYALMGAKRRIAPRDSRIGIHRMFAYEGTTRRLDNGAMAAMLRRYSNMMGVSPELVAATEQGTPDAIRILTPAEIARWRLASPGS
jgi:hypothetical protein